MVQRFSNNSDNLAPPPSPYPDHVDPSPTDSNGTERTEIEEEAQEQTPDNHDAVSPTVDIISPKSPESVGRLVLVEIGRTNIIEARNRHKRTFTERARIRRPTSLRHTCSIWIQAICKGINACQVLTHACQDGSDDVSSHAAQSAPSPTVNSVRSEGTVVSPNTPETTKLPDVKVGSVICALPDQYLTEAEDCRR